MSFFVIFLRSLFQLLLGLILSLKTTPFDSQEVDSVLVFAIDLEQPRFDMHPSFHLIFDPTMTPKFAQNWFQTGPRTCSNQIPKMTPKVVPNLVQNWPKIGSTESQDSPREPKKGRDSHKGAPRGPRGPGGRQGASKRQLLETLKWRPEAHNRGSRRGAVHISGKPS